MAISVRNVSKRFGDFVALRRRQPSRSRRARSPRCSARAAAASRPCCGSSRASSSPIPGTVEIDGVDLTALPPQRRNVGFVFQHYAAFKHMTVCAQRRLRPGDPQAAQGGDHAAGQRAARAGPPRAVRRPLSVAAVRRPAPAHGAGPRARGRARRCCCSTSRSVRSTPRCARSCAPGCGACTTRSTSPPSSSPTTRKRRWTSPTASS